MQASLLLDRLVELDTFDLHYMARNIDPAFRAAGYTLHRIPARRAIGGSFILDTPALWSMLKRLNPAVIYQRVASTYTGIAAAYARRHGSRMVWHISSDRDLVPLPWSRMWHSPLRQLNRSFVFYGARHADVVVVQNREQAALLRRWHNRDDTVLIPNFHLPPTGDAHPGKPQAPSTVCWIGNIKPLKQLEVFLQLAAALRGRPDVEFVVVGAPQLRQREWDGLLGKMHTLPNVKYLGAQPRAAVETLLARAHILVNTSTAEGFANTFIESWMRDVAVLSLGVNPDGVFNDRLYGICAAGSYVALLDALKELLDNPQLRREMTARSAVFARERFGPQNIDRLIALLRPASDQRPLVH